MDSDDIELTGGGRISSISRDNVQVLIATGSDVEPDISDSRPLLPSYGGEEDAGSDKVYVARRNYDDNPVDIWRKLCSWNRTLSVTAFGTLGALGVFFLLVVLLVTRARPDRQPVGPYWKGFSKIENYFAFGDSWTTTHFIVEGEQPSTTNPVGNPPFPGFTSTNGINYVGYLATQYNHSFVKAYDMAYSGSTIDAGIDRTLFDWLDLPHQVKSEFAAYYTRNETGRRVPQGWLPENSLFSAFFGINDVFVYDRASDDIGHVFATYKRLIGDLYDMSARNFLIINIPPMDRSPSGKYSKDLKQQKALAADIREFNDLIKNLIRHLRKRYIDITIFEYDIQQLFARVIDDPKSVPQTKGYKDTETRCQEYDKFENGAVATKEQIELCGGLDVDQYLWLNGMHTTAPVHEAMAAEIEKLLLSASPT